MEITAKVISRLEKRTGTSKSGKDWQSQQYVVAYDYDKQYPHNVLMSFFGDKVAEAASILRKDSIAKFAFDINAREVETKNGKAWFGSNDCYAVNLVEDIIQSQQPVQPQAAPSADPFIDNTPAPAQSQATDTSELPF